jgi:hypothetical protein
MQAAESSAGEHFRSPKGSKTSSGNVDGLPFRSDAAEYAAQKLNRVVKIQALL